jgi:hypothetical protein
MLARILQASLGKLPSNPTTFQFSWNLGMNENNPASVFPIHQYCSLIPITHGEAMPTEFVPDLICHNPKVSSETEARSGELRAMTID